MAPDQKYKLVKVLSKDEFAEVVRSMWDAYENPPQHLFSIFCPPNAQGARDREEAVKESADRLWDWHSSDNDSYWQKMIDIRDNDKVVGGALWKINMSAPHGDGSEEEEAYWHPKGGQREFANQVLETYEAARSQMARRPHIYLNIIWTHPDYQRQGIGSSMLEWGIAKAAEMKMEMWLNAWRYGRSLYEKHGFVTVEHHIAKPKTGHPDEAWKRCADEWTDLEEWVMWRPRDGPYQEGRSVRPWLEP